MLLCFDRELDPIVTDRLYFCNEQEVIGCCSPSCLGTHGTLFITLGDNAGSALWTGGVTAGGAGAPTPRPLQACLCFCPAPAGEEAPPPGSQQPAASLSPPLPGSAPLRSVPVASLGFGAPSCVTTKVQSLCSRRRDGPALSPLTEGEIDSFEALD